MASIYPYAHILHLFCAIIFLGYVFFDVVILPIIDKKLDKDLTTKCRQAIGSRAIKIMPYMLLTLILTGGMMMSAYVNSKVGFFDTPLQQVFMIKVILAFVIALGVVVNLSMKAIRGKTFGFMQRNFHKIVLVLGFTIVLLAKLMFIA